MLNSYFKVLLIEFHVYQKRLIKLAKDPFEALVSYICTVVKVASRLKLLSSNKFLFYMSAVTKDD